jgi:ACR3 family arsenite efflux pump ArsB
MEKKMNFFEKYLRLWVVLCMIAGVIIVRNFLVITDTLRKIEF